MGHNRKLSSSMNSSNKKIRSERVRSNINNPARSGNIRRYCAKQTDWTLIFTGSLIWQRCQWGSHAQGVCPFNMNVVNCLVDPCLAPSLSTCDENQRTGSSCESNFCGGCVSYLTQHGRRIHNHRCKLLYTQPFFLVWHLHGYYEADGLGTC